MRRVSAIADSGASAGWQHVKISRSWSSGIGDISSSAAMSIALAARSASPAWSRAMTSALSVNRRARRTRSIARLRAVVVIHAPGLSGIPSTGQRSRATT